MRRKKPPRALSRREHGLVVPAVGTTEPLLNRTQLRKAEAAFIGDGWGVIRRSAMSVLSMSGAELVPKITSDRATAEGFARLDDEIQQYLRYLRAHIQLLQTASARTSLALCYRKDKNELRFEVARMAGARHWVRPDILSSGPPSKTDPHST